MDRRQLAGHVAVALTSHIESLRRQGLETQWRPLLAVRDSFREVALSGHPRTFGGDGADVVDNSPMEPTTPQFVDCRTAAKMLGCNEKTVRRRVKAGELVASGPSRRAMLAVAEIERYKESLSAAALGGPGGGSSGVPPVVEVPAEPQPVDVRGAQPSDHFVWRDDPFNGRRVGVGATAGEAMASYERNQRELREWWNSQCR